MIDYDSILGSAALVISLCVLVIQILTRSNRTAERLSVLETDMSAVKAEMASVKDCVNTLKKDIAPTSFRVDVLWKIVEQNMPRFLHAPTHTEMDSLLELMARRQLDTQQALRLKELLTAELERSTDFGHRLGLLMAIWTLEYNLETRDE